MELMTNYYSSPKLVLKINLEGKSAVKIQLVAVNKDFIKTDKTNNYNYYKDIDKDFVIWSTQDFIFNERQIRLPDELNLTEEMVCTYDFKHDIERYDTLKKMYQTLQVWSQEMDQFFRIMKKKDRVIVEGDYWYIT